MNKQNLPDFPQKRYRFDAKWPCSRITLTIKKYKNEKMDAPAFMPSRSCEGPNQHQ